LPYRVVGGDVVAEVETSAEAPLSRTYTWLRCDRGDGRVQVCRCWSVP
jgi:hypothetical protein